MSVSTQGDIQPWREPGHREQEEADGESELEGLPRGVMRLDGGRFDEDPESQRNQQRGMEERRDVQHGGRVLKHEGRLVGPYPA